MLDWRTCQIIIEESCCSLVPYEHSAGPDSAVYSQSDAEHSENSVRDMT